MKISEWRELFDKIENGEFDFTHESFPNPVILGMMITGVGINMMIVEQKYGEEMDKKIIEYPYKPAAIEYAAVDHFANSPDPSPFPKPKPTHKNVKGLFNKKRKKIETHK